MDSGGEVNSQTIVIVRHREKSRLRWKRVDLIVISLRFLLWVLVVINMIAMFVSMLIGTIVTLYLMLSLGATFLILWLLRTINAWTTKRVRNCIDKRFAYGSYERLISALSGIGIKEPGVYLATHGKNVDAYKNVKLVAVSVIESEMIALAGKADADEVYDRGYEIAMLVFPGDRELAREHRILHLLKDRGITDLKSIKEMMDVTEDAPLSLSEGAL